MTTDDQPLPAALPEPVGLAVRLRGWFDGLFERRRRRLSLIELGLLDDRLLRDIGIEPGDVRNAILGNSSSVWLAPMRRFDRE